MKISGGRIKQARLRAGLTQAQLARLANTSERNIVRWEKEQNSPRFNHLAAIAAATGRDMDDFFADDDDAEAAPMAAGGPQASNALTKDLADALYRLIDEHLSRRELAS